MEIMFYHIDGYLAGKKGVEKMNDKISIIVPIYNVEKYLEECIKSLVNQTYDNLEIILVDDGSPDKCGEICDRWEKMDDRIQVYHKKNGGLSDARNWGLKFATGKYVAFVDSDDYVEKNTYESAIKSIKEENAQIFIMGRAYLYGNEKEIKKIKHTRMVMNNEEALDRMNSLKYYDVAAWDKVCERVLFKNIEFPIGKLSEDWYTMYKILDRASKIVYDSNPLYVYRQRNCSITHSDNIKINEDPMYASEEVWKFIRKKYPNIEPNAIARYVYAAIGVYNNLLVYKRNSLDERKKILLNINKNYKVVRKNSDIGFARRVQLILIVKFNLLYNVLIKIFKKRKEKKITE